jgi:hypothetical protein
MLQLIMKHVYWVGKIYYSKNSRLFVVAAIVFVLFDIIYTVDAIGYTPTLRFSDDNTMPLVRDPNLRVEEVVQGLELPTTMAFLDAENMLVLEKDKGTVQRIVDGQIMREPAIDVNVATEVERCMCGIAVSKNNEDPQYVFLYFSEAMFKDGGRLLAIVCIGTKY